MGKPQKIALMSAGTRGDIQPYIAAAMGLKNAGYHVKVITCTNHETFVQQCGLDVVCCFCDSEEAIRDEVTIKKALDKGDAIAFLKGLGDVMAKKQCDMLRAWSDEIAAYKPDLLVEGSLTEVYGVLARYKLGIPVVDVKLQFIPANPRRMVFGFPNLPCGLNGLLVKHFINGATYKLWEDEFDPHSLRLLGYKITDTYTRAMFLEDLRGFPIAKRLVGQPSFFAGPLYQAGEVPSRVQLIGQLVIKENLQLQVTKTAQRSEFGSTDDLSKIAAFIGAGSKPVYMGWGSMTCKSPEYMVELVARGLQASGMRAIIQGGWAKLSMEMLQQVTADRVLLQYAAQNALFIQKAPHEWLFKQCACLVHHGGAGTLGCGIRSGVPQIITPVWLDQWDHAHLVNNLGVGVGFEKKQLQKLTATDIGDAIKTIVNNPKFTAKAAEVSEKVAAQDGVQAVVRFIEHFWQEEVETGKYKEAVEARLRQNSRKRGLLQRLGQICCASI